MKSTKPPKKAKDARPDWADPGISVPGPLSRAEAVTAIVKSCGLLMDSMPDLIYVKDVTLRNLAVNAAYERFVGRPRAAILGHADEELLPPTLAAQCRKTDQEVLESGRAVREEQDSGTGVLFETVKAPVYSPSGELLGLIGISRDVTAQKRAEAALRAAEERLLRVVADAPLILFQLDARGVFTLSEGRALKALGLNPGEVVGRSVFEVYAHNPSVLDSVRRALAGETISVMTEEAGMVFETHYAPRRSDAGEVESVLGVAVDVSERRRSDGEIERLLKSEKELRQEAEKASRAKDDFLALLSHELRTPMTAMMGWTYLLKQKEVGGSEFNQALDVIERNMHLQAQIIEDLLDVSKIFTGRMRVDQRVVDLGALLRSAVDVVRPAAQAHSITIDAGTPAEARVSGDPERLQQVCWNLLSNAMKFTPEGGKVLVRLKRSRTGVELTVTDSGAGIPPEYLPHVFDPFSQAEQAITREHRGLGLGLAIVRHIVELHGGSVAAQSEGLGCGSTFTVRLPLPHETPRLVPAPGSLPAGAREVLYASLPRLDGIRVLVVQDEAEELQNLSAALKGLGAEVDAARSAAEALKHIAKSVPDVLVADLVMRGEDGYSLIRRVRALPAAQGGEVPAAAMTSQTRLEDRTQVLIAGYQMYLPKPVEPVELAAVVRSLARKKPGPSAG
ncbi:MAG: PAS domain-containing protein [Elusimicrobia bacterium]|nr:PAS domain-containing protein [Elusimicrobiota bacterium]